MWNSVRLKEESLEEWGDMMSQNEKTPMEERRFLYVAAEEEILKENHSELVLLNISIIVIPKFDKTKLYCTQRSHIILELSNFDTAQ